MTFAKIRIYLVGALGAVLLLVGGVYLFREPIKETIRETRAERIMERAELAFAEERWEDVVRLGQAAHFLIPDADGPELLVALALLRQRDAATISWWERIIDQPDLPIEDLRLLISGLLGMGDVDRALPFINRLVELDPDAVETRRLWLQSLQEQGRYARAFSLAEAFTAQGEMDWNIHRTYLQLRRGEDVGEALIGHLAGLLEEDGPLSLNAARELVVIEPASPDLRDQAATYLLEHAEDDLDRLYAVSHAVQRGQAEATEVFDLLDRMIADPGADLIEPLAEWVEWYGAEDWFAENVTWELFQASGGAAEPYLALLLRAEAYDRILALTQNFSEESGDTLAAFLYFRSQALVQTGEPERAAEALGLSVQAIDPEVAGGLESFLLRGGYWELLEQLYQAMLLNDPEDEVIQFKILATRYFDGDQGALLSPLRTLPPGSFEDRPNMEGLLCYLHLILKGSTPELHQHLERLMTEYPEVFDFRLLVGVSHVLRGNVTVGRSLAEEMPELGRDGPLYLRVAAVLLGYPADALLGLQERADLLPREKYLLSLVGE